MKAGSAPVICSIASGRQHETVKVLKVIPKRRTYDQFGTSQSRPRGIQSRRNGGRRCELTLSLCKRFEMSVRPSMGGYLHSIVVGIENVVDRLLVIDTTPCVGDT
jgi:hypothetical protein